MAILLATLTVRDVHAQPFTNIGSTGLQTGGAKDGGLSWADFNDDGCLDLAVNTDVDCGTQPNCGSRILLQRSLAGVCASAGTVTGGSPPVPTLGPWWDDVTQCLAPILASNRPGDVLERSAVWGDLDNDGYVDLVLNTAGNSTASGEPSVEIWMNGGPGTTTNGTNGASNCGVGGVAWNQFGTTVSGSQRPSVTIDGRASQSLPNAPFGGIQRIRVINGTSALNAEMVALLDYDADGNLDVIIDNHGDGTVILNNSGDWTAPHVDIVACDNNGVTSGAEAAGRPFSCDEDTGLPSNNDTENNGDYGTVVDVDNDGNVDVVLRKPGGAGDEDIYLNDGTGPAFFALPSAGTVEFGASSNGNKGGNIACDFDNDGDLDVFWSDNGTNQIFEQTGSPATVIAAGDGEFSAIGLPLTGGSPTPTLTNIDGVACADWDNDGDSDLYLSNSGNDVLLRNDFVGSGTLSFTCLSGPGCGGTAYGASNSEAIAFGDTDRDGDLDLIINRDGNANQYWRNTTNNADYLMVEVLYDDGSNDRPAIGATVVLSDCDGTRQSGLKEVNGGRGHGSQDPSLVHFGVDPTQDYVVYVRYPGGLLRAATIRPDTIVGYQQITVRNTDGTTTCPTPALVIGARESMTPEGPAVVWQTAAQGDTLSLQLFDARNGHALSEVMLNAGQPGGAEYRTPLHGTPPVSYWVRELDVQGQEHWHGPFESEAWNGADAPRPRSLRKARRQHRFSAPPDETLVARVEGQGAPAYARARLEVTQTGLQAIPLADFAQQLGGSWMNDLSQHRVRLHTRQTDIPYRIEQGRFFFYAEGPKDPLVPYRVYWLEAGVAQEIETAAPPSALFEDGFESGDLAFWSPTPPPWPPSAGWVTTRFEENLIPFVSSLRAASGQDFQGEVFYWGSLYSEGTANRTFDLSLAGLTATPTTIRVGLRAGQADGPDDSIDHDVEIFANGNSIGVANWPGYGAHVAEFAVPAGGLVSGTNQIEAQLQAPGGSHRIAFVDWIEVDAEQQLVPNGTFAEFVATSQDARIAGLPPGLVVGIDSTDPSAPRWLTLQSPGNGAARLSTQPGRRYFAGTVGHLPAPLVRGVVSAEDVVTEALGHDYLVLFAQPFADGASELVTRRAARFSALAIDVQRIYDQFSNGEPDPRAIREFLTATEPDDPTRVVTILGKGTFDYRNVSGYGANHVPPLLASTDFGIYATDRLYLANPSAGNTVIGRLPFRAPDEVDGYLAKLDAFEASADFTDPRVLSLVDSPSAEGDFLPAVTALETHSPTQPLPPIDVGTLGVSAARSALLDALDDDGTPIDLLHFSGHGGSDRLTAPGVLTSADVPLVTGGAPLVVALTCNAARYDIPQFDTLGETWIVGPGGGAGFYSSVALSSNSGASTLAEELFSRMFGGTAHFALALRGALEGIEGLEDTQVLYQFLGDAALLLSP